MNIYTVRDNLKRTIAGKEMLLATYENPEVKAYPKAVRETMSTMLEININELKEILKDVEVCCNQALEASWALNPERMGQ